MIKEYLPILYYIYWGDKVIDFPGVSQCMSGRVMSIAPHGTEAGLEGSDPPV